MTTTHPKRQPLWRRRYEAFKADCEGVVAVEFALIALPFFIFTVGLLEVALLFIMSTTLDYGVDRASREIRTGQVASAGVDADGFKQSVCDNFFGLIDCDSNLVVDVRTLSSFGAADLSMPIDEDGEFTPASNFQVGGRDSIVLVRVYLVWDLLTPLISGAMANTSDGDLVLASSAAFRNEPF